MAVTDPVADFLTRIRNALTATHSHVDIPASNLKLELARILKEQGYINDYAKQARDEEDEQFGEVIRIELKYVDGHQPAISGLKKVSNPGRRVYVGSDEIPRVQGGMGTSLVSTSQGLLTGHDARKQGVGGELLAEVW